MTQDLLRPSSLVMSPGFMFTTQNQVSILAMEASGITTAKKSSASSHQCESDADLFFLIPVASCITNTHPKVRQLTRSTTCRFYVAFEKLCEESGPTCGQQRIFSSCMTMPPHSAHVTHAFLAKNSMSLVRQASYSPDLAPCDFWLFPKLKTILKGRRFQSREDIKKN